MEHHADNMRRSNTFTAAHELQMHACNLRACNYYGQSSKAPWDGVYAKNYPLPQMGNHLEKPEVDLVPASQHQLLSQGYLLRL